MKVRKFVAEPNGLIKAVKALGLSLLVSAISDPDDSSFSYVGILLVVACHPRGLIMSGLGCAI